VLACREILRFAALSQDDKVSAQDDKESDRHYRVAEQNKKLYGVSGQIPATSWRSLGYARDDKT